jgi:hypothetical protein
VHTVFGGITDSVFTDDAIRIEKYYQQYRNTADLNYMDMGTEGSITVHINSNRDGNGRRFENWLDYAVEWCVHNPSAVLVRLCLTIALSHLHSSICIILSLPPCLLSAIYVACA